VLDEMAVVGLFNVVGCFAAINAIQHGSVSMVNLSRYSRVIFAFAIGVAVLDERPDLQTIVGATGAVVVGIYLFWRHRGEDSVLPTLGTDNGCS
jgi:drug/metabolite transporter (DMT)-like permease